MNKTLLKGDPVYTDTLISTIVDLAAVIPIIACLYRHFNFYYCR